MMANPILNTAPLAIHPWFIIGFWLVSVSFFLAIALAMRDGIQQLHRLHRVPCTRCAFYTGEYRLKCTVNPYQALSEAAIGCLDYEENIQTQASCTDLSSPQFVFIGLRKNLVENPPVVVSKPTGVSVGA
ncbi:MAG: hypothetical protein AAGG51_25125 [Cyanobacteria bacterium P01_G01_bin.54]